MTPKKIRIIVNPISGVGKQKIIPDLAKTHLNANLCDYEITYTKSAGHATELAREAVNNNFDIVAIVGGDGSVNETGTGLLNTSTSLAIIPAGSGNGLARHLNIPLDLSTAIEQLNRHQIKKIEIENDLIVKVLPKSLNVILPV